MVFVKARVPGLFLLLVLCEFGVRTHCVAVTENSSDRPKRSLTTICVEIKPNGPREEPYYMCRGTEFPTLPQMPTNSATQPSYSNMGESNQPGSKQIAPAYVKNDAHITSYTNGKHTESGMNSQNSASHYRSSSSNAKNNNGYMEPVTPFHTQFSSGNHDGSISSSDINGSSKGSIGSEGFPKHSSSTPYHKPTEQQYYEIDYHQQFHKQSQSPQQEHSYQKQLQNQAQSQKQQSTKFYQSEPENFRPSTKIESSAHIDKLTDHDAIYSQGNVEQPTQNPSIFSSYETKPSNLFAGDSTTHSHKNPTSDTHTPHGNKAYATSQHRHDATGCGDNCGKPISTPSTESGYSNGRPFFHREPAIQDRQSLATGVRNGKDKITPAFQSFPQAVLNAARTQPQPSPRFGPAPPTSVAPNERPLVPYAFDRAEANTEGPTPLTYDNNRAFHPDAGAQQRMNFMQQQPHAHFPAAHRYRTMIDDEVLQVPNWGFSPDELDFYRAAPEPRVNINPNFLPMYPTPQTIPLEHLEDPVMWTFYSSLPDVGPLPVFKPLQLNTFTFPQQGQQPAINVKPPTPQNFYQPSPVRAACQVNPPLQGYNSCIPPGGYNFQPVFIALPCYNPSAQQPMMPQVQISYPGGSFEANRYSHIDVGSPLGAANPNTMATPSPANQLETHTGNSPNTRMDENAEPVEVTTPAKPHASISTESIDFLDKPTNSNGSRVKNANTSNAEVFGTIETKNEAKVKSNGSAINKNSTEINSNPSTDNGTPYLVTTPSADRVDGDQSSQGQARTTFKSLFLTARKLAQMVYDEEQGISTPKPNPKRQRQTSKANANGNGSGKRKFAQ